MKNQTITDIILDIESSALNTVGNYFSIVKYDEYTGNFQSAEVSMTSEYITPAFIVILESEPSTPHLFAFYSYLSNFGLSGKSCDSTSCIIGIYVDLFNENAECPRTERAQDFNGRVSATFAAALERELQETKALIAKLSNNK